MSCFGLFSKKNGKKVDEIQAKEAVVETKSFAKEQKESSNFLSVPNSVKGNPLSSDGYPSQDTGQQFVNTAGKIGKNHHNYFKEIQKVQSVTNYRPISKEELAQHIDITNAWMSLNGIVYDVTTYIRYHPGGKVLLQGCGKESMDLFNKYHQWVNFKFILEKYKLGYLTN